MSKFFNLESIAELLPKSKEVPKTPPPVYPEPKTWLEFATGIREEIRAMQRGESAFYYGGLHLSKNTCISMTLLDRFYDHPSKMGLLKLIAQSRTDFGAVAEQEFRRRANAILKQHNLDEIEEPLQNV